VQMSHGGVENLLFVLRHGSLFRSVVPSFPTEGKLGQPHLWQRWQSWASPPNRNWGFTFVQIMLKCGGFSFPRAHTFQVNNMKHSLLATIVVMIGGGLIELFLPPPSFKKDQLALQQDPSLFIVAVVGKLQADGQYSDANAKVGSDVWKGASAYVDSVKDRSFFLTHIDDQDNMQDSRQAARDLASNPRVLAVIGHSISASTQAAVKFYAEAGIPLILPVATSPLAVYPELDKDLNPKGDRIPNAYRLRPGDDRAQAPAIAFLVSRIAELKANASAIKKPSAIKVHLVLSNENDTRFYSKPLGQEIQVLLKQNGYKPDNQVDEGFNSINAIKVANEIKGEHDQNDVVIFCGYTTEATLFLNALKTAYGTRPLPTFIFSEASTDIEKQFEDLVIYRTAPDDLERCHQLPQAIRGESSEFISGYDAARILTIVAQRCSPNLSRRCFRDQLDMSSAFPGTCRGYSFRHGESVLSTYYIFKSQAAPDLQPEQSSSDGLPFEVSAGSIIQMQAGRY
jgi:hypothetical protein